MVMSVDQKWLGQKRMTIIMVRRRRNFSMDVSVNLPEFIKIVQEDNTMTTNEIVSELRRVVGGGRDHARQGVESDTGALYRSIRTFSYKPPIGYVAVVGFSAGGYEINIKTGRVVDYAEIVDLGYDPHGRDATFFFTNAETYVESIIDPRLKSALNRVARRR